MLEGCCGGQGRRYMEECEWALVGAGPAVLCLALELANSGYISS